MVMRQKFLLTMVGVFSFGPPALSMTQEQEGLSTSKSTMSRSHQVGAGASAAPARQSHRPPEEPLPRNPHHISPLNGPLKFDERRNMYYHGKSLDEMKNDDVKAGRAVANYENNTFWGNVYNFLYTLLLHLQGRD